MSKLIKYEHKYDKSNRQLIFFLINSKIYDLKKYSHDNNCLVEEKIKICIFLNDFIFGKN